MSKLNKWLCALLSLLLALIAPAGTLAAAEGTGAVPVYVRAFTSAQIGYRMVELREYSGEAYIKVVDLAAFSSLEVEASAGQEGTFLFSRSGSIFSQQIPGAVKLDGAWWLPLRASANQVRLKYWYDPDLQMVYFYHKALYEEDLIQMAREVFGETWDYRASDLSNITENVPLKELSTVFNRLLNDGIIMGAIKSIIGTYGREMYEGLLKEMLVIDESDTLALYEGMSAAQKVTSTVMSVLTKAEKAKNELLTKLQSSGEIISDHFGPFHPVFTIRESEKLKLYNFWEKFPAVSPADLVELYYNCHLADMSAGAMLRGFHYALADNSYVDSLNLDAAIYSLGSYIETEDAYSNGILWDMMLDGYTDLLHLCVKGIMEKLKVKYNDFIVKKLYSLINDNAIPVVDRAKAVEATLFLQDIQAAIAAKGLDHVYAAEGLRGQSARESLVAAKYCALFYLRAAEVGYEKYLPDPDHAPLFAGVDMSKYIEPVLEKVRQQASAIAAFDDDDLLEDWKDNEALDLTAPGFLDIQAWQLSRPRFADAAQVSAFAAAYLYAAAYSQYDAPALEWARIDYDGDGAEDWAFRCPDSPGTVCFIDGIAPASSMYIVDAGSSDPLPVYYVPSLRCAAVQYTNEEGARCLAAFNEALQEPYLLEDVESDMDGDWLLKQDGRWYGTQKHDGTVPFPFRERELAWEQMTPGEDSFTLDVPASRLEELLADLSGLDRARCSAPSDRNDDGLNDAVVFFRAPTPITYATVKGAYTPCDTSILTKEEAAVAITTDGHPGQRMNALLLSGIDAADMLDREDTYDNEIALETPGSAALDGEHRVLVYKAGIRQEETGAGTVWIVPCEAFHDRQETFTDAEVAAMQPGTELMGVSVFQTDGTVEDGVVALNNGDILLEALDDDLWHIYYTTEAALVYDVEQLEYRCRADCDYLREEYDGDSGDMVHVAVGSPMDLFMDDGDWEETVVSAKVRVEGGMAVSIATETWYDFAYDYFVESYHEYGYPDQGGEEEYADLEDPFEDGYHPALLDRTEIIEGTQGGWTALVQVIMDDSPYLTWDELSSLEPGDVLQELEVWDVQIDYEEGSAWLNGGEVMLETYDEGETWIVVFAQNEQLLWDKYTVGFDFLPGTVYSRDVWGDNGEDLVTETYDTPFELLDPYEIEARVHIKVENGAVTAVERWMDE